MMQQNKHTMSKQRGFTLLEALIAFLILSIGLLGIASLQLISLKAGHTATLRTVAVIKAQEMFERIRNNQTVLDPATAGSSYASLANDPGTSHGCSSGAMCNYVQIAQDDIYNWKADLIANMPTGTKASIEVLPKTPGVLPVATVTVTIYWKERDQETKTMVDMNYSVSAHICDNGTC